jgi:hypothetical protein
MLKYIFGGGKKTEKFINIEKPKVDAYLVFHKTAQIPIGIFDSLEEAKEQGRKSTYCNCIVYKFKLNDECKYINNPEYEDV